MDLKSKYLTVQSIDTIEITIFNDTNSDRETFQLIETGVNSGIFRACINGSTSSGLAQQDGTLNASASDNLSAIYTDPIFGDQCNDTAVITPPTFTKQLYLSTDGTGSPDQDLDRIDPAASGDGTTATSETLEMVGGNGTVVFDNSTEASSTGGSLSFSHTFGGGDNPLLVVGVAHRNGNNGSEVSSITFDGTSLTQLIAVEETGHKGYSEIWYLPPGSNPGAATTANVVITIGGSPEGMYGVAANFSNANQTTPFGTPVSNSGQSGSPSTSVSSVGDIDMVFDMLEVENNVGISVGGGQTLIQTGSDSGGKVTGGMSSETGIGSITMSWSGTTPKWAITAVAIKPAPASGGGGGTVTTTFTQTPVMCSNLEMPIGGAININTYVNVLTGTMPANPDISAVLKSGTTIIDSLINPTYTSGTGILSW